MLVSVDSTSLSVVDGRRDMNPVWGMLGVVFCSVETQAEGTGRPFVRSDVNSVRKTYDAPVWTIEYRRLVSEGIQLGDDLVRVIRHQ